MAEKGVVVEFLKAMAGNEIDRGHMWRLLSAANAIAACKQEQIKLDEKKAAAEKEFADLFKALLLCE